MFRRLALQAIRSRLLGASTAIAALAALAVSTIFYGELHFHGIYIWDGSGTAIALPLAGGYLPEQFEIAPLALLWVLTKTAAILAGMEYRLRANREAWLDIFVLAAMSLAISTTLFI